MIPRLYLEKKTAALYIALIPHGNFKTQNYIHGLYNCIRISPKNKWSYQVVGQHWFGYTLPNDKFEELDIGKEFEGLPDFQRKIMRATFGNYKRWQ